MVEQLGFPLEGGGSNPTLPLQVKKMLISPCDWGDIVQIFRDYHYRGGAIGGSIRHCFMLTGGNKLIGGAVFGDPRHRDKYGGAYKVLELRRFALIDEAPKNSESYFIAKCLWWLKKHTVVERVISYADPEQGHEGTIYRASGFKHIGMTSSGQIVEMGGREYHARSLTIDRDYSRELRESVASGDAVVRKTCGKHIYSIELRSRGNRA